VNWGEGKIKMPKKIRPSRGKSEELYLNSSDIKEFKSAFDRRCLYGEGILRKANFPNELADEMQSRLTKKKTHID